MRSPFVSFSLFIVVAALDVILSSKPEAAAAASTSAAANYVINPRNYHQIELARVVGPESIAFDCHGQGPYVGVSDGTILKWQGPSLGWIEFAFTSPNRPRKLCDGSTNATNEPICGRPLGLKFNSKTCDLYIADAYFGLLKTGPNGGKPEVLASSLGGVPFMFINALDVDEETGIVYFTDTSTVFQRRVWMQSILAGDKTGRLLKYDPCTKEVTVLLHDLGFANGVALSKDKSFILVAESAPFTIHRLWLRGSKAPAFELFAQLERPPDNIKSNYRGEFWVALNSGRGVKEAVNIETSDKWLNVNDPVAAKFDEQGKVVQVLDGEGGPALESVSEVEEQNGNLWVGSAVKPYVGVVEF
ncbi:hypothetical protein ACE6H2_003094 [Prunus campanulata]